MTVSDGRRELAGLLREVGCWPMDFRRMGRALHRIREMDLWKQGAYRSFSDLCEQEWGFQERFALRLIDAADDDPPRPARGRDAVEGDGTAGRDGQRHTIRVFNGEAM